MLSQSLSREQGQPELPPPSADQQPLTSVIEATSENQARSALHFGLRGSHGPPAVHALCAVHAVTPCLARCDRPWPTV